MSAQVLDWLAQGVTLVLVIYFGLHLRSQLCKVKSMVETQKATIEAQAESMKAQSAVLQDFERYSKIMQQVIDFFDPKAQLQREQAYKERVERDLKALEDDIQKVHQRWTEANKELEEYQTGVASIMEVIAENKKRDEMWLQEQEDNRRMVVSLDELPSLLPATQGSSDQP